MGFRLEAFYSPSIPKLRWDPKEFKYVRDEHGHEHGGHEEEEEEQEGAWMFLFIDLVLVALTSKCALVMEYCALSPHSFLFSATTFIVMFLTRQFIDEYVNRFFSNDLFHRLCYFVYVGAFFVMALNVNAKANHSHMDYKCKANLYGVGFGTGFCLTRAIMAVLYLGVMYDEPERAFEQFCGPLVRNVIVLTVVIILMFAEGQSNSIGNKGPFPPANRIYIYLIATILEFAYDAFHNAVLAYKKSGVEFHPVLVCLEYYPLDLEVYQERLGAFIMLVLGESMICLLIPYFDVLFAAQTYTFHMISYCIIFCYGVMYYDSSNHADSEEQHAVNHSLLSAFIYFWIHVFIGLSVFYTSAAMGILYLSEVASAGGGGHSDDHSPDPTPEDDKSYPLYNANTGLIVSLDPYHAALCKPVQLLAASCGMAVVFMGIMRALHNGLETLTDCEPNAVLAKERWAMAWRIGCGVFHFTVPYYGLQHPIENAGIHLALLAGMLVLEVRFGPKEEGEGSEEGSHAEQEHAYGHGHGHGHGAASIAGTEMEERMSRLSGYMGSQRMPPHMRPPQQHRFPPASAAALMHKDPRALELLSHPPPGRPQRHPLDSRSGGVTKNRRASHVELGGNPMHY